MFNIGLLFLRSYWREVLIAGGFVITGLFVTNYFHMRDELAICDTKYEQQEVEKKQLQTQLDDLNKQADEQKEKIKQAEAERQVIVEKIAKDINTIKLQTIPKDCQGAIDFAIKNKGDLKW